MEISEVRNCGMHRNSERELREGEKSWRWSVETLSRQEPLPLSLCAPGSGLLLGFGAFHQGCVVSCIASRCMSFCCLLCAYIGEGLLAREFHGRWVGGERR